MRNKFAEKLQKKIIRDLRCIYSARFVDHWWRPKNWGIMNNASGYAKITGPCGDTMEISVKVENDQIIKCTFDTDGCGASIACGSIVTEMAEGKLIRNARNITQKKILQFCGGLPEEDQHCALLAANTLQKAIDDYEMRE